MFAQHQIAPGFEERLREEVLDPYEQETQRKLELLRQYYPQANKVTAILAFVIAGLLLNRVLTQPRLALEKRLERAAERIAPWGKPKRRRRR